MSRAVNVIDDTEIFKLQYDNCQLKYPGYCKYCNINEISGKYNASTKYELVLDIYNV